MGSVCVCVRGGGGVVEWCPSYASSLELPDYFTQSSQSLVLYAHTNFFAQFQSTMFSQFRLQLSPLAKSISRGRRDAQLNFHRFYLSDSCAFGFLP